MPTKRYYHGIESLEQGNITHLDLSSASITDADMEKLAAAITNHIGLISINLSDNQISDRGALYLANAISSHPNLTELNMGQNKIGDNGLAYLAQAVKANKHLRKLNIEDNTEITDKSAIDLAEALSQNNTLTELILNGTGITTDGAVVLIEALKENVTLYNLSFGTLDLSHKIKLRIIEYQDRNKTKRNNLLDACKKGDIDTIDELLSRGVSVHAEDEEQNTGLHIAAKSGQLAILNHLLAKGAILSPNKAKKTPLLLAEEAMLSLNVTTDTRTELTDQQKKYIEIVAILRTRPSAYIPVARNLRKLIKDGKLAQGNKELATIVIEDMEWIANQQKQHLVATDNRLTVAIDDIYRTTTGTDKRLTEVMIQTQEKTEALAARIDDIEKTVRVVDEPMLEIQKYREAFKKLDTNQLRKARNLQALLTFQKDPNLFFFNRALQIKLEELFIGCRAIASGFMAHTQTGTITKVATGIQLLGNLISLIPSVGSMPSTVTGKVGDYMKEVDYDRQLNKIKQISFLLTNKEQKHIAQAISIMLTEKFSPQLNLLRTLKEEEAAREPKKQQSLFDKILENVKELKGNYDEFVLKSLPMPTSQQLAEFAVLKMLEALQEGVIVNPLLSGIKLPPDVSLEDYVCDQLFSVVTASFQSSKLDDAKFSFSRIFGLNLITTRDNREWRLQEVFCKPGVLVDNERYLIKDYSDPKKYDYRLGDKKEIEKLKLIPAPTLTAAQLLGNFGAFGKPAAKQPVAQAPSPVVIATKSPGAKSM